MLGGKEGGRCGDGKRWSDRESGEANRGINKLLVEYDGFGVGWGM